MGMYFSSTLTCLNCENFNTFDTSGIFFDDKKEVTPEDNIIYISQIKPRIECERCGSDNIHASDDSFFSYDMSFDKKESKYEPLNFDKTWILQDNQQRLPEEIYLDPVYQFQHDKNKKYCNLMIRFSDFDRYIKDKENLVLFKRTKQLSEIQDLYQTDNEKYKDCIFAPTYIDRIPKGKTIFDYSNENTLN